MVLNDKKSVSKDLCLDTLFPDFVTQKTRIL